VIVERIGREGWAVTRRTGLTVGSTRSTTNSTIKARLNDLIRDVRCCAKTRDSSPTGSTLTDAKLLRFAGRIGEETLALAIEAGPELRLERA
jgi:hypothetical protein